MVPDPVLAPVVELDLYGYPFRLFKPNTLKHQAIINFYKQIDELQRRVMACALL